MIWVRFMLGMLGNMLGKRALLAILFHLLSVESYFITMGYDQKKYARSMLGIGAFGALNILIYQCFAGFMLQFPPTGGTGHVFLIPRRVDPVGEEKRRKPI